MTKENNIVFQPTKIRIRFEAETTEGMEKSYVDVWMGYDLDKKLRAYYTGENQEFLKGSEFQGESVFYLELLSIEYLATTEEVDFKMRVTTDDAPQVELGFTTAQLNASHAETLEKMKKLLEEGYV